MKIHGRRDARRLPRVERSAGPGTPRAAGRPRAGGRATCASRLASTLSTPRMTRGSTSTSRRTKRQSISRAAQARTISSRRSVGAFGIVTKTMSGRVRSSTASMLAVASGNANAVQPPASQPRVVVDERRRRVRPASRAARAACCGPLRPAPTIRTRRPSPLPRQLDAADDRALGEACADDRDRADQRVDHEDAAGEVAERRPASARRCPARRPPRRRPQTLPAARRASSRSARRRRTYRSAAAPRSGRRAAPAVSSRK